ncbi:MAG: DJ-1/PfpI family protein, partial [Pseudolabrys sp.]
FVESGKPVGVICHGPWTLVEAGVVNGRTLTSYPSVRTGVPPPRDWLGSVSPEPKVIRRLLLLPSMIAPLAADGKRLLPARSD